MALWVSYNDFDDYDDFDDYGDCDEEVYDDFDDDDDDHDDKPLEPAVCVCDRFSAPPSTVSHLNLDHLHLIVFMRNIMRMYMRNVMILTMTMKNETSAKRTAGVVRCL